MDMELKGKKALVTGSSKGIGLAVAKALAAEGCTVHMVARTAETLEAARAEVVAAGDAQAHAHPTDLSQQGAAEALAQAVGDVDILVNNAGAIPGGDIAAIDEATWREAWDLKVFGYVNLVRLYYARLKARGGGVIVNVVGLAGERPDFGYIAGSAGNAALMAFSRGVGGRSLDDNIRVVGVNPGPVETDRIITLFRKKAQDEFGDPERWREYMTKQPLGRAAKAEEVADLVTFLASPRASYISGTVVTIDGGLAHRG